MNGPYVDALLALSRAKVDFVIVGVTGINFFARDASVAFVTQDLDVLHDFPYALVSDEAVPFRFEDVTLRVAALERLLESKRRAGREKDLRFLEAFEARRKEFLSEPKPPTKRSAKRAPRPKPKK